AHGGETTHINKLAKALVGKHGTDASKRFVEALHRQVQHLDGGGFLTGMGSGAESFAGAGKAKAGKSNSPASGGSPDDGNSIPTTPVSQESDPMGIGSLQSPTGQQAPSGVSGDPFSISGADSTGGAGSLGAGGKTAPSFGNSSQLTADFARGGFARLVRTLAHRPGVTDPKALAAAIGRKKYGAQKFNAMSHRADGGEIDFRSGGKVPGRAKVAGDSYSNDTVPAELEPKQIVIPRSITTRPDAPAHARAFVAALKRKHGSKSANDDDRGTVPAMLSPEEAVLSRKDAMSPDAPNRAAELVAALTGRRMRSR
ncbi:MAG: hypothetical protein ACHQ5A_02370, partial [Opitutales bacterium]